MPSVESPLAGGSATGREAIERLYVTYFAAFPDLKLEQDDLLIDGDDVALLGRADRYGQRRLHGHGADEAQGQRFASACSTRCSDGQIVRERRVYDFTGLS